MQSYLKSCHISRYNAKISVSRLVSLGFPFLYLYWASNRKKMLNFNSRKQFSSSLYCLSINQIN